MKAPLLRSTVLCLLAICLTSCSIGYNREWRKVAAGSETTNPTGLAGAWDGTWKSEASGHTGTLRAIVTHPTASWEKDYRFKYRATWAKVLSGVISADHQGIWKDGRCTLSGEKDLGILGGVYRFTGEATPTTFTAKYESKLDHGVFEMKRPQPVK